MLAVRPLGDADEFLLAWGQKYRLDKPDQVLVRLNVGTKYLSLSTTIGSAPSLLKRTDPSGAGTRVMTKSVKAIHTY